MQDVYRRIAKVGPGARWGDVIAAAAPFGLAPLSGSDGLALLDHTRISVGNQALSSGPGGLRVAVAGIAQGGRSNEQTLCRRGQRGGEWYRWIQPMPVQTDIQVAQTVTPVDPQKQHVAGTLTRIRYQSAATISRGMVSKVRE